MLMRIVRTLTKRGHWAEFEREFFENAPDMHGVPGIRGSWILQDLDDMESGFVVELWDSEEHARAFELSAVTNRLLKPPLPGEFEFHICEIRSAWIAGEAKPLFWRAND
jgi:quinol monooxygenase YgiN